LTLVIFYHHRVIFDHHHRVNFVLRVKVLQV